MASTELTYSEVSTHTSKKDIYIVVHDKVYNCSSFVDEHPGGEEVLLDVGGQDATEAFEDVGHSDEAREILEGLLVGPLKRQEGDPKPHAEKQNVTSMNKNSDSIGGGFGSTLYIVLAMGALLAGAAYYVTQNPDKK